MDRLKQLESLWRSGKIDRRSFVKGAVALGLSAAALPAAAAMPRSGGNLRLGLAGGATTDTLDPGLFTDDVMRHINWAFRNNLTEIDNTGALKGELAESMEATDGGKTWRFGLRKGVTFHNGKSLDANDVIASMNYHRGDTKSGAKPLLAAVEGITADGDTVVFTLKDGNADFAVLLTDYHLSVMPGAGQDHENSPTA